MMKMSSYMEGSFDEKTAKTQETYNSPSFKGWRDSASKNHDGSADIAKLKNILAQKQKMVNSINIQKLPDRGDRLLKEIEKLKSEISKEQTEISIKEGNSEGNSTKELQCESNKPLNKMVACTGPLCPTDNKSNIEKVSLELSVSIQAAKIDSSLEVAECESNVPVNKTITWAGPPCLAFKASSVENVDPESSVSVQHCSDYQNQPITKACKPVIWAGPPSGRDWHNAGSIAYSKNQPVQRITSNVAVPKHSSFQGAKETLKQGSGFIGMCRKEDVSHSQFPAANLKTYSKAKPETASQIRMTLFTEPHSYQNFHDLWSGEFRQRYYGGRMTDSRIAKVQSVTEDAIIRLHKSLDSCPGPEVLALDPAQLSSSLMPHQRQALAWMLWREQQDPPGGILADDMGLGKTLTLISLVLSKMQTSNANQDDKAEQKDWLVKKGCNQFWISDTSTKSLLPLQ